MSIEKLKKSKLSKRWMAENGESSRKFQILGKAGADLVIPTPLGTLITTDDKNIIGDLNIEGEKVIVANGGKGGDFSNSFLGQKGQISQINLELKLVADVGLVGFPNAGKSTLLKGISRAKPKIASYPFTTIRPNVGKLFYSDHREITIADLPGLIEGAGKNEGMGHSFLKHVERTKMILFVIDVNGFRLSNKTPFRTALETFLLLNKELELYRPDLVDKPSAIVINKLDTQSGEEDLGVFLENYEKLKDNLHDFPEYMRSDNLIKVSEVIPTSAKFNPESVKFVKERVRILLDVHDEKQRRLESVDKGLMKIEDRLTEKQVQLV